MSPLLTPQEAASRLGINVGTLAAWRCRDPRRLAWVQVSARAIRYRPEDIDLYIERRLCGGRS